MPTILSDLKLIFRRLLKSPGFTATAVLMLAFGIGATTAIFSIVDGVLLRPLPFPGSDRLVTLGDHVNGTDWGQHDPGPVTAREVNTYIQNTHSFESLGGFGYTGYELAGTGNPVQVNAARLTPSVFTTLGVAPLMGRVFTAQEDEQKEQVAVLSYATWKDRFSGNPNILGTKILLDRKPYLIIGVMPRSFEFPLNSGRLNRTELWVPMSFSAQELAPESAASWSMGMVGRLRPGITVAQAKDDAGRVAAQIMRTFPPDFANFRFTPIVYPLQQITVLDTKPLLRVLFLAVVVVLLIACANLAGLLLVRAIRNQREIAVRLAIGASASTILRQMILESLVLSIVGGLLGIGLAALALAVGKNYLPETMPLMSAITLNWAVVGFALLLAVLTGFFCGLAPGFAALRTNVNESLKEGGRSGSVSGSHARLRSALVVMEIAIALVLLAASGLLLRSFSKMSEVDLGFRPNHVTTAAYSLPQKQYPTQALIDNFNSRLLQQLQQQPGVEAVGLTSTLPTTGDGIESFVAEGYVDPRGPDQIAASPSQVIGDYFKAMGIRLTRGRYFTDSDNADNQLVVIVNHEFAQRYWPNQNPIGKRMRVGTLKTPTVWMTVVGEVADAKLTRPDADASEQFYQPVAQLEKDAGTTAQPGDLNGNGGYVVLRSALPADQMENILRTVVRSIDPQLPLTQVQTMDEVVAQSEAPRRFNTIIISSFALAAVLLAVLGIYSIIAFSVASRVQEMAIRMALGSQRSDIVRLVLFSGLKLAVIGCVIGLAAAAAASRILSTFLFQVSAFDPLVMALTALAVFALALVASALPAHRAASVNPNEALRGE
ncbi:ABC transporter permease [Terracidiphilus gabretensis]|uniref:ABC transporter permease n=1 Tax=Terracidiphilus gabretensis TaxID=1577687 RepID=UPI00071B1A81|nr:ABC transporter permease [Terracidiphilus gabretensis]